MYECLEVHWNLVCVYGSIVEFNCTAHVVGCIVSLSLSLSALSRDSFMRTTQVISGTVLSLPHIQKDTWHFYKFFYKFL
jgi:energy-converting hydrogenase Eha subunit A